MLTGQAWSKSGCHENAKLCPQVHRLQDAGGSLRGAKTTLALPLGRILVYPGRVVASPLLGVLMERFDEHISRIEKHNPG